MPYHTDFFLNYISLRRTAAVVALTLGLAGCNEIAAQHAAPIRPVLVTAAHYQAQVSDRSFVGTIRPRIESDIGFLSTNMAGRGTDILLGGNSEFMAKQECIKKGLAQPLKVVAGEVTAKPDDPNLS